MMWAPFDDNIHAWQRLIVPDGVGFYAVNILRIFHDGAYEVMKIKSNQLMTAQEAYVTSPFSYMLMAMLHKLRVHYENVFTNLGIPLPDPSHPHEPTAASYESFLIRKYNNVLMMMNSLIRIAKGEMHFDIKGLCLYPKHLALLQKTRPVGDGVHWMLEDKNLGIAYNMIPSSDLKLCTPEKAMYIYYQRICYEHLRTLHEYLLSLTDEKMLDFDKLMTPKWKEARDSCIHKTHHKLHKEFAKLKGEFAQAQS